jgi:hypothetical protein
MLLRYAVTKTGRCTLKFYRTVSRNCRAPPGFRWRHLVARRVTASGMAAGRRHGRSARAEGLSREDDFGLPPRANWLAVSIFIRQFS